MSEARGKVKCPRCGSEIYLVQMQECLHIAYFRQKRQGICARPFKSEMDNRTGADSLILECGECGWVKTEMDEEVTLEEKRLFKSFRKSMDVYGTGA